MIKQVLGALKFRYNKIQIYLNEKENICNLPFDRNVDKFKLGGRNAAWVIPQNLINEASVCICVGAGEDVTFDAALVKFFNCDVHIFDPTPKALEYFYKVTDLNGGEVNLLGLNKLQSEKMIYYPYGIWKTSEKIKFYKPNNKEYVSHSIVNIQKTEEFIIVDVKTLKDALEDVRAEKIDLLKIDIEGAEYEVIKSILDSQIRPKVFCIEFDEIMNPIDEHSKKRIQENIKGLLGTGYKLFYFDFPSNYTFVLE